LEEKLDEPGCNETGSAGDTDKLASADGHCGLFCSEVSVGVVVC